MAYEAKLAAIKNKFCLQWQEPQSAAEALVFLNDHIKYLVEDLPEALASIKRIKAVHDAHLQKKVFLWDEKEIFLRNALILINFWLF